MHTKRNSIIVSLLFGLSVLLSACGGTNNTGGLDPLREVECTLVEPGVIHGWSVREMRTVKRKATVLLFLLLIALSACAPGLGTMGDPTSIIST